MRNAHKSTNWTISERSPQTIDGERHSRIQMELTYVNSNNSYARTTPQPRKYSLMPIDTQHYQTQQICWNFLSISPLNHWWPFGWESILLRLASSMSFCCGDWGVDWWSCVWVYYGLARCLLAVARASCAFGLGYSTFYTFRTENTKHIQRILIQSGSIFVCVVARSRYNSDQRYFTSKCRSSWEILFFKGIAI